MIEKEFDRIMYKGQVPSHDKDPSDTNCRIIFRILYVDGDIKDLFIEELIKYIKTEDAFNLLN